MSHSKMFDQLVDQRRRHQDLENSWQQLVRKAIATGKVFAR